MIAGESGHEVAIPAGPVVLYGMLEMPAEATGVVLFAHGSGSSRHSPRNRFVAGLLRQGGFGTLLFDLLTAEEERVDEQTRRPRFDIGLLAQRLVAATDWVVARPDVAALPIGYFGASTGAAAALVAAARRAERIGAVVSRGGRPDLAGPFLRRVRAATLLIVGERDRQVVGLNEAAKAQMVAAEVKLEVVPGAGHLFEEPGALERVAELAVGWMRVEL